MYIKCTVLTIDHRIAKHPDEIEFCSTRIILKEKTLGLIFTDKFILTKLTNSIIVVVFIWLFIQAKRKNGSICVYLAF